MVSYGLGGRTMRPSFMPKRQDTTNIMNNDTIQQGTNNTATSKTPIKAGEVEQAIAQATTASMVRGQTATGEYTFLPYNPKAPVVEVGMRTIKIMYKVAKSGVNKGVIKGENSCLLVTPLTTDDLTEDVLHRLMPHVLSLCESTQDAIAKELHGIKMEVISKELLDVNAIIGRLETEAISNRLNKETIGAWFDSSISDMLTVLFADKLGLSDKPTTEETIKLMGYVSVYKTKLSGLASNLTSYGEDECDQLLAAIDKCEVDSGDIIASRLVSKLEAMKIVTPAEELLSFL